MKVDGKKLSLFRNGLNGWGWREIGGFGGFWKNRYGRILRDFEFFFEFLVWIYW
jgi:hypothetical protein